MSEIDEIVVLTDEAGDVLAVEETDVLTDDGDPSAEVVVVEEVLVAGETDEAGEAVDDEADDEAYEGDGADEAEDDEDDDEDEDEGVEAVPAEAAGPGRRGSARAVADDPDLADELDTEGDVAADYLEELLDIADLDGDIDTYTEGDRAHVSIVTDSDQLVGRDGAVLDALQDLARLAVLTQTGRHSRLMLDVAGFREKRRAELRQLALDAVTEVKASGEAVRLAPMNPFERKIVHDTVAANGLISESEGVEPQRRVVISPVD